METKPSKGMGAFLLIALSAIIFITLFQGGFESNETYTYKQFLDAVEERAIQRVDIYPNEQVPTGRISIKNKYVDTVRKLNVPDVKEVQDLLTEHKIVSYMHDVKKDSAFMTTVFPMLIVAALFLFFMMYMMRQAGGNGNNRMMNFHKSHASLILPERQKIGFQDVAGLEEEKEELKEVVDFLREPKKYLAVGARIPKGVLLVGPPGTGKTLLAKAVAGEAGVPFFSISGSDFMEMFVGVGASRVRDLFEEAKQKAPCIVFIDEIDAVARQRGAGMGGSHDEREQTLNQMLVEMDGFQEAQGVIVMAATNRVDILDPAILRPGRFDRKVGIGKPDVKGRREILNVHVKEKPLGDDVDLEEVARTTAGFTGADLENLMNEAAILAAKAGRAYIVQDDIKRSFVKVGIGTEKKSKIISDKEKRITAYHEAGHAILFHVLPDVGPVHTISVIPTGVGAAGYTMPMPGQDEMFRTKGQMLQDIMVGFGGRIAEELVIGDVTTGASQDIRQSTAIARAMVTKYGMSEKVGAVDYGGDHDEVFIGRDLAQTRVYGETMQSVIDSEVKRIVDECYAKAKDILEENLEVLHSCAELLIKQEKVGREEFEQLFVKNA